MIQLLAAPALVTSVDERTDEALLRAFVAGDGLAFEALVLRHGAAVKGYAVRMLQNAPQAEEVYVDTFHRVATHAARWEPRGSVRGWIFTIAHRMCIDVIRQRKVARDAVPHLVDLHGARTPTPSPEAHALLREEAGRLEEALARLPEEHRQVLLLRIVHGLSAAETGAALGLREDQVNSALSYARKRLRVLLEAPAARAGEGR
ncbi:MAG: RNA polymerase sigma factor [Myxococcota bacterium]